MAKSKKKKFIVMIEASEVYFNAEIKADNLEEALSIARAANGYNLLLDDNTEMIDAKFEVTGIFE